MNRLRLWRSFMLILVLCAMLMAHSGSVVVAQEAHGAANHIYLPLVTAGSEAAAEASTSQLVKSTTDQIIVHYRDPEQAIVAAQAMQMATLRAAAGSELTYVHALADQSVVVRLPEALDSAALQPLLDRITQLPDVLVAEPDLRVLPQMLPNDPRYGEQWHYFPPTARNFGVNMPGAWDVTTGAPNLVVAVLDTGQLAHEDLDAARIVPGYDFISSAFAANDGDGRDANPHDEGDGGACGLTSTWHGTHIAGTIGAKSNNGRGVAGINWQSKIQHVRVLGICGGFVSDIIDATYWAAGLNVPGIPRNATPAKVLNMSFGIIGTCSAGLQNAINAAVNAGSVVVVSAGNEAINVDDFLPANCNNVITVAATDRSGDLAFYSNYGAKVELAAPGGFTVSTDDVNGILSTLNTGVLGPEADTYAFYQGTSMAAPHVTGIISLMLSVNPSLTPAQVLSILQSTATSFPAGSSCRPTNCGTGLVNAMAAVTKAKGGVLAPSYLQATMTAGTQIALRWADNTVDESGFKVERCQGTNCTNFTQIATLSANRTSYTDAAVVVNTSYRYRVRATKNGVDSVPSNLFTINSGTTACALYYSVNRGPTAISELRAISAIFAVGNHGTIRDVNLRNLNIEHPFDMDLAAVLSSPAGTRVELFNGVGGAGANFSGTTFDDAAPAAIANGRAPFSGSYRPSRPLSAFNGQTTTGTWTLSLSDNIVGYEGWFYDVALELCTSGSRDGGGGSNDDVIFEDGFDSGGFGQWTATSTLDGGDLSVNATAALAGTRGMSILIDDTRALYVTDDSPNAEPRYRARFKFDPNSLTLPNGKGHYIFYGYQGTNKLVLRLEFRINKGVYQLRGALRKDNNSWQSSSWVPITDAPHSVELDWQAATANGANNGSLTLWIDGTQTGQLSGIDNDSERIDRIRLGAIAGIDAGSWGSYYFDGFASTRTTYIGPTSAVENAENGISGIDAHNNADQINNDNVVEEDLNLDDVGIEDVGMAGGDEPVDDGNEQARQQIFLPLVSR